MIRAAEPELFDDIRQTQIRLFRPVPPDGAGARASQGLVVVPTDSATVDPRASSRARVGRRTPGTAGPQGPQRLLVAGDLIGSSQQIAEQLFASEASREIDEVAFAPATNALILLVVPSGTRRLTIFAASAGGV